MNEALKILSACRATSLERWTKKGQDINNFWWNVAKDSNLERSSTSWNDKHNKDWIPTEIYKRPKDFPPSRESFLRVCIIHRKAGWKYFIQHVAWDSKMSIFADSANHFTGILKCYRVAEDSPGKVRAFQSWLWVAIIVGKKSLNIRVVVIANLIENGILECTSLLFVS